MSWKRHRMVAVKMGVGPTIMLHSGAWFDFCAPAASSFTIEDVCACRKSNPDILVMQPAQDRAAMNVTNGPDGARYGRILF